MHLIINHVLSVILQGRQVGILGLAQWNNGKQCATLGVQQQTFWFPGPYGPSL